MTPDSGFPVPTIANTVSAGIACPPVGSNTTVASNSLGYTGTFTCPKAALVALYFDNTKFIPLPAALVLIQTLPLGLGAD